jgi:hypothetical protein
VFDFRPGVPTVRDKDELTSGRVLIGCSGVNSALINLQASPFTGVTAVP